jgi:hypothetical protein
MKGFSLGAVVDLVAAACSWGGDEGIGGCLPDGGKKDELSNFH